MEVKLKVLELFAGIGGFSVGLERTGGFEPVAFCEIDKHARKVLQNNWPTVPIYEDVKEITVERLKADGTIPDVITGGFPCQDISTAGRGAGLAGERSGLWFEFARIIKEVRPRWVIAENVSALRYRGLDQVLRSLAEVGYDAEWHCIPASAVGAPHQRDRIWIVAYPSSSGCESLHNRNSETSDVEPSSFDPYRIFCWNEFVATEGKAYGVLAYSTGIGSQESGVHGRPISSAANFNRETSRIINYCERSSWPWHVEPSVGRVADGVPGRTHRLKQLGNAVVPQIPEIIGRAILERMKND